MQVASQNSFHDDDNASSPAIDSPNTPVNNLDTADVKIASLQSEHDALGPPEPIPVKLQPSDACPPKDEHVAEHVPEQDVVMDDDHAQDVGDVAAAPVPADDLRAATEETVTVTGQGVGEEADEKMRADGEGEMVKEEEGLRAGGEDQGQADVEMAADAGAEVKGNADADMQLDDAHDVPQTNGLVNGNSHHNSPPLPSSSPPTTGVSAISIHTPAADHPESAVQSPSPNDNARRDELDNADQPPAKRARKSSDADVASAHASATPPTMSQQPARDSAPPPLDPSRPTTFSAAQHKFAVSTIRTLKKLKDAVPFRLPVDAVALGIPHYSDVIKHPMDLTTIERTLASSNPAKPDPNPKNPRYATADEFIADVRLMFTNSVTFNGPDHPVTLMGKRVEEVFDKQIKYLPSAEEARAEPSWSRPTITARPTKPLPVKKIATPPPPPPPAPVPAPAPPAAAPKKAPAQRRPSTNMPTIRRNEAESAGRPKREIHPPPTKELPYTTEPKKRRRVSKAGTHSEQLKFCAKVLDQLNKKSHYNIVSPFAEPVDIVKLQIPDYPKIVKKPMDLRTMREKLERGEYPTPEKFYQDFRLIIDNCFLYNARGTPVHQAGIELDHLFQDKWKHMPPERRQVESEDDDDDDDEEEESDAERARAIAQMEQQMASMRENIEQLKAKAVKKPKVKEVKKRKVAPPPPEPVSAPVPSSSKVKKETRPPPPKKKTTGKKVVIPDDDVLSFDQKKELSDAIQSLGGDKLEKVISIIHEGVPEIANSQEEIELEIDSLPAAVLSKLYNFVVRPMRPPPPKKPRTGKGTGTGGLKRKSMDEAVEEAKIRKLEAQMRLFEDAENGGSSVSAPPHPIAAAANGGHESSDSSSDDDSSGSDSE